MNKEQFVKELKVKERGLNVDIDYALKEFNDKVEPYLEMINHWKFNDGIPETQIGNILGMTKNLWEQIKAMSTMRQYLQKNGYYMQAKTQIDFLKAKKDNPGNAKFHEMALKRFDRGYGDKENVQMNFPSQIDVNIQDASMSDEELTEDTED